MARKKGDRGKDDADMYRRLDAVHGATKKKSKGVVSVEGADVRAKSFEREDLEKIKKRIDGGYLGRPAGRKLWVDEPLLALLHSLQDAYQVSDPRIAKAMGWNSGERLTRWRQSGSYWRALGQLRDVLWLLGYDITVTRFAGPAKVLRLPKKDVLTGKNKRARGKKVKFDKSKMWDTLDA